MDFRITPHYSYLCGLGVSYDIYIMLKEYLPVYGSLCQFLIPRSRPCREMGTRERVSRDRDQTKRCFDFNSDRRD